MRDGSTKPPAAPARADEDREHLRQRFDDLRAKRGQILRDAEAVTEEIYLLLREAHDAGWSWSDVAEISGFGSADVVRAQAARVGAAGPTTPPPGTYTVREAADLLGVSPQAVYAGIRSGRIHVADDRVRGRRVYLPADSNVAD